RGVDAKTMAIEELRSLEDVFDGAISNFGALNCVADLGELSEALARLVRPQGKLALCVMSRFCWRTDWRHLLQRWSGLARWRGIDVFYRSAGSIARDFAPCFIYQHRFSLARAVSKLLVFKRLS